MKGIKKKGYRREGGVGELEGTGDVRSGGVSFFQRGGGRGLTAEGFFFRLINLRIVECGYDCKCLYIYICDSVRRVSEGSKSSNFGGGGIGLRCHWKVKLEEKKRKERKSWEAESHTLNFLRLVKLFNTHVIIWLSYVRFHRAAVESRKKKKMVC